MGLSRCPGRSLYIDVAQSVRTGLKLGQNFENDVILIRLRIESVYLPLSKRVVKGRTDLIGIDVEPRRGRPIIFEMGADSVRLLIRGHIGDFGKLTHFGDKFRGPLVEFIHIGIFECVLILCAADTIIDCEVLNGLQVDVNAG